MAAEQEAANQDPAVQETKGTASSSFQAAASIGQYTGDIPKVQDAIEVAEQQEGISTDQAIQLAEERMNPKTATVVSASATPAQASVL